MVTIVETDNRGFIWAKCDQTDNFKLYDTLYTCFVYISPSDSVYCKAHETDVFKQLEAHIMKIQKHSTLGKLSIVGDLNARIGSCDDFAIPHLE